MGRWLQSVSDAGLISETVNHNTDISDKTFKGKDSAVLSVLKIKAHTRKKEIYTPREQSSVGLNRASARTDYTSSVSQSDQLSVLSVNDSKKYENNDGRLSVFGGVFPRYLTDTNEANVIISKLSAGPPEISIDLETTYAPGCEDYVNAGLVPEASRVRLVQLYAGGPTVYLFDLFCLENFTILKPLLESKVLVSHNAIFENKFLAHYGITPKLMHCTALMARVLFGCYNYCYRRHATECISSWGDPTVFKRSLKQRAAALGLEHSKVK